MKVSAAAQKLYKESIIIDGQLGFEVNMPWSFADKWELVNRYARAGFTALTLSIANEETTTEETFNYLAKIRKHIFSHSDKYILAKFKEDVLRAKRENKIALRLMFQGTNPIGKNLDLVEIFYELGITSMLLTYNIRSPMGDGVIEERDAGLSHLGKKFIAEMNRLDMIIDGSHGGYQTTMQALALSHAPMVFSHSGVYGIHPHVRNVRDEQIHAVAKSNGLIGINGINVLLGDPEASVEKYVEHIHYIRQLTSAKHIALGLDNLYFADQFTQFMQQQKITHPEIYANAVTETHNWKCIQPEDIILVVELLIQRGYSNMEVKEILGENILRLMK